MLIIVQITIIAIPVIISLVFFFLHPDISSTTPIMAAIGPEKNIKKPNLCIASLRSKMDENKRI